MTTATVLRPYITSIFPQSLLTGADSTVLTINGKRFQRGAAVYFNARKLTNVRIDGDSVIVVVIPGELTVNADMAVLLVENPDETKIGMRVAVLNATIGSPCFLPNALTAFFRVEPTVTTATFQAFALRIEGSGLSGNTRVFLDGQELAIDRKSTTASYLAAQVPASLNFPGIYNLNLISGNVSSCVAARIIIMPGINFQPSPAISRAFPAAFPPSGGILTISGVNFSERAVIRLDATNLDILSVSSDRIVAIAPPNLGYLQRTFLLSVTNPDGQVASLWWGAIAGVGSAESQTTLSPNPVTTALTLETTLDRAATLTLTLRNILGEAVLQEHHTIASGRFTATLDVSTLANGVYLLEMSDGAGGRWVQKVVKY